MKAVHVILLAILAFAVPSLANAAVFNVDTTNDDANALACTAAPNDCSLRGAIIASNADLTTPRTINLPAGTYGRTSAYPNINVSLSIFGAGAATTVIDANGNGSALRFEESVSIETTTGLV